MRRPHAALSLLALSLAHTAATQTLPYNPTRLLRARNGTTERGFFYLFAPGSGSQASLSSLEVGQNVASGPESFRKVSDSLPFWREDGSLAYTPVVDENGNLTVVAGDCGEGVAGLEVWRFAPEGEGGPGGEWTKGSQRVHGLAEEEVEVGANFLADAVAFSEKVGGASSETSFYAFGGMCPFANSSAETWTEAAEYSNTMLTFTPNGGIDYDIGSAAERGPPIAQAGSTITPLLPTYSDQLDTRQQDFVLIGGHTATAFINMSQVALLSLPQQSWSFLPIMQPAGGKTDLAVRQDATEITPRSGHTAVLAEDGKSIILVGGWVGDVNTPADPQLAVLELGAGYGGSGEWQWTVPQQSGSGMPSAGIYGHGAAMLPGGVLMIAGGYAIQTPSSSSSSRVRRRGVEANDQVFLYNVTGNTWLESYSPPADLFDAEADQADSDTDTSEKVGLGTGLGIGCAVLFSAMAFYFWYSKRVKRSRQNGEHRQLFSRDGSILNQISQPFLQSGYHERGGDETTVAGAGRFWPTGGNSGDSEEHQQEMQATTGMWMNVPSPTRGLRKGVANKNYQYHAAPRYDEKRMSRGSGNIHPIAEQENEDEPQGWPRNGGMEGADDVLGEDPFQDPEPNPLGSHPVSPVAPWETVKRVSTRTQQMPPTSRRIVSEDIASPNWTAEPEPQQWGTLNGHSGRVSPTKTDDRTSSTLSDRSFASTNSITQTMSTRTGAMLAAAAGASHNHTGGDRAHSPTNGRKSPSTRARSSTCGSPLPTPANDADSFTTAKSSFAGLQQEGEALLGGRPALDPDDPYRRALAAHASISAPHDNDPHSVRPGDSDTDPAPLTPARRRPGLMGSLRRALHAVSTGERSFSLTANATAPSHPTSPTHYHNPAAVAAARRGPAPTPRRAMSDGGALLRQKRGRADWEDDKTWHPYRDDPHATLDPNDDWGAPSPSPPRHNPSPTPNYLLHPPASNTTARNTPTASNPATTIARKPVNAPNAPAPSAAGGAPAAASADDDEPDWDIEGAATRRDVQVMFTVPKSRLRVVNDDMDRASLRSASDGGASAKALSRSGSVRSAQGGGAGGVGGGGGGVASQESLRRLRGGGGVLGRVKEWEGKGKGKVG